MASKHTGGPPTASSTLKWAAILMIAAAVPTTAFLLRGNAGAGVPARGTLTFTTAEPGAEVLIAGEVLGRTPLTMKLAPGSYAVELRTPLARRTLVVDLPAGNTVTHHVDLAGVPAVAVPAPAADATTSPSSTERPVATQGTGTRPAPGGNQAPATTSPAEGNATAPPAPRRAERRAADGGARTASSKAHGASGLISINALPWADVWIDGEKIGQTPIGNVSRPVGQVRVVLRHPELGERTETVTITAERPARLGVDMRRK